MAKQKFYVVWKGIIPGVYNSWDECKRQVENFEGALYKSFPSKELAEKAYHSNPYKYIGKEKTNVPFPKDFIKDSLAVDAACSGNPGLMEYRGVYVSNGQELFLKGPYQKGTNNVGEFLAIVHGLAFLKQRKTDIPIYSDSVTAMLWVKNKKCKTKLELCEENKLLFELIERAEKWLNVNTYKNKILKWETDKWGEIPADFGRK
ncbi:MAG: ribonuclease H family protein [Candidatus Azobacteroides sp.]|nr:ribonuclease H family protein [Candidatus Azobacteroides sp.]